MLYFLAFIARQQEEGEACQSVGKRPSLATLEQNRNLWKSEFDSKIWKMLLKGTKVNNTIQQY